jgi:uncharacterized protein
MRTADADILIVPGLSDPSEDHWQSRWVAKLPTARRVDLGDWQNPKKDRWIDNLATAVASCTRPVMLVGHSLGVVTVVHAAPLFPKGLVAGAFLVSPHDVEKGDDIPRQSAPSRRSRAIPCPFPPWSSPAGPTRTAPTNAPRT